MAERIAIIGTGQTRTARTRPDISMLELIGESVRSALDNAEITMKDIDLVVLGNIDPQEGIYQPDLYLVDCMGGYLKPCVKINNGGATGGQTFCTAWDYIGASAAEVALVINWAKFDEGDFYTPGRCVCDDPFMDVGGWQLGTATNLIVGVAKDLLRRKAVTEEQIARLRVKIAECASRNPYAHVRTKLTVEDVISSPVIQWPIRRLHHSPPSCGSYAGIVASESKTKKISKKPAWIIDGVVSHGGMAPYLGSMGLALGVGPLGPAWRFGVQQTAEKIYKRNGITNPRKELDVMEIYEPSPWSESAFYECTHICEYGEPWKLIEEGATAIEGDIPFNPSGGTTSTNTFSGAAAARVLEAAMQVRGEAGEHQVPQKVKRALAISQGGDNFSTCFLLSDSLI